MPEEIELYRKYRPKKFSEVIGQEDAIKSLISMGTRNEIPHALLFTGDSGTGKTTIARILRRKLGCSNNDFYEYNSADFRGIDTVRDIRSKIGMSPLNGKCKVYLLDECHQLSTAAQEGFLKLLEDTPSHVYFMLATTDPEKLKKTIITRCTEIKCRSLTTKELCELITKVINKEKQGSKFVDETVCRIAEAADGSARLALVLLHKVIGLENEEDQLKAIQTANVKAQGKTVAQALFKGVTWKEMASILKEVDADPEKVRYSVLGYMKSILLKSGNDRAAMIIEEFRDHFYDSKAAGLAVSCFNIINSKQKNK